MPDRFKIYPEINFAISIIEPGPVQFENLYNIALNFRKHKHFTDVHYSLIDLRGTEFKFELERLNDLKKVFLSYQDIDNQKLAVYMVDFPVETAYVHLFFKMLEFNREYCTTLEGAYDHFSLPISFEEFTNLINI
jgi:hypothetical protein